MKAARALWLLNRLRCMPTAELGYRVQQAGLGLLERRGWIGAALAPAQSGPRPPAAHGVPALDQGEAEALRAEADHVCAGRVSLFGNRHFDVGAEPEWNRDPDTGILAPSVFARDIDVAERALVGDIKHLWELNRHLQLVRLAQAALVSGEPRYLRTLAAQLRGWLAQCPPLTGPNWVSPLELGIRLVNWSLLWQLLGGEASALFGGAEGQRLYAAWLHSIHAHCAYIARHLSRHSSANNHLIGELAGLFMAAATWPCWPEAKRWRALAAAELEQQAQAQYSRDGVNREQAFAYHVFSAEFLFAAGLAGQAWGQPFSRAYWDGLWRALTFLRSVRDVGGNVPMVGDADDGMAFRLGPVGEDRAAQLLALGDAVFKREAPAAAGARWLLHLLPGAPAEARAAGPDTAWAFPDGGYLLFGSHWGEPREIKGVLDCGPLGYLGIAAHGHADALALTLSVGGEQCLVDPGTYSYWQERKWRDYFRGTSAHNTLRVDGLDQSVGGGRFLWLKKARVAIERMPRSPSGFDFRGSHDGYLRLADPARHVRSVRFDAASASLVVRDELAARRPHLLEQFWHFAPGLDLTLSAASLRVRGKSFEMLVQVSGAALALELVQGSENPPLGWYSRSYGTKHSCNVLRITTQSSAAPVECRFTIGFHHDGSRS
jgi:hypothetical protein